MVGQGIDTVIVISFIFYDQPLPVILNLIISGYLFKVVYEILATPLTYLVVNFLKRREGVDTFDAHTDFSPFRAK